MFLNAFAFPLCNAKDILWNRNMVSLLFRYLSDSSSHFGDKLDCFLVPRSYGFNCFWREWWVFASSWYFALLLSAARFAAADAVVAVSAMYELA